MLFFSTNLCLKHQHQLDTYGCQTLVDCNKQLVLNCFVTMQQCFCSTKKQNNCFIKCLLTFRPILNFNFNVNNIIAQKCRLSLTQSSCVTSFLTKSFAMEKLVDGRVHAQTLQESCGESSSDADVHIQEGKTIRHGRKVTKYIILFWKSIMDNP